MSGDVGGGREGDELFGEFHYARALYESAERLTVPYPGGQMSHVLRLRPLHTRSLKLFDKDGGVICSKRMRGGRGMTERHYVYLE